MRITATTTVTGPYIMARYRDFAARYPEHELTLLEFGRVSGTYAWNVDDAEVPYVRRVLSEDAIERQPRRMRVRRIAKALSEINPDLVVVCGYGVTGMMAVLRWARTRGRDVPVVLLSDSNQFDEVRRIWKEWVKQRVVGLCNSALVAGNPQKDYLARLGMAPERIRLGYDVVDNAYFIKATDVVRSNEVGWREGFGLPARYFLASARFVERKNLLGLISGYAAYRRQVIGLNDGDSAWHLVLLGDGEQRAKLEEHIAELELNGYVHLLGFKQYEELPLYYALAGVFVHASLVEQWGLVVNEAMASGLPVLVSSSCGCALDLVEEGRNGFAFEPLDAQGLARLLSYIASDRCDRQAMGAASRAIISAWSPETFAQGLAESAEAAMAGRGRVAGWLDRLLLWALSYR